MNADQPASLAPFLGIEDVAKSFGVSVQTIRRRVRNGEFPPPVWKDKTMHRWSPRQILAFREQLEREAAEQWRAARAAPETVSLSIDQPPPGPPPAA
jgi:predicted DNA-binding transcriptional regulator AlpA